MKVKNEFVLREMVGLFVVIPVGQRVVEFNGILSLNESGALLWRKMMNETNEQELLDSMLENFDIDEITAKADIQEFLAHVQEKGLIEE